KWQLPAPYSAKARHKRSRCSPRRQRQRFSLAGKKQRDQREIKNKPLGEGWLLRACFFRVARLETKRAPGVFCATVLPFFFSKAATIFRTQLCLRRGAKTFKLSSSEPHCKMSMSTYRTPQLFTSDRLDL